MNNRFTTFMEVLQSQHNIVKDRKGDLLWKNTIVINALVKICAEKFHY